MRKTPGKNKTTASLKLYARAPSAERHRDLSALELYWPNYISISPCYRIYHVYFVLPVVDLGEDAREDDVDEGASPPRAPPPVLILLRDFRLDEEEEDTGALPLEGLGLLDPTVTVGTRSLAKSWAWRASLARRYLL